MASVDPDDSETVLADLELTRGLTIQMTAIGTLGMVVGLGVLSTLYRSTTVLPLHHARHAARWRACTSTVGVLQIVPSRTGLTGEARRGTTMHHRYPSHGGCFVGLPSGR